MKEPTNNPGIELARQLTRERMRDFGEALKRDQLRRKYEKQYLDRLIYMLKLNGWSEDKIEQLEDYQIESKLKDICTEHRQLNQKN